MQLMSTSTMLFMDGIFKTAPRLFSQLYTVYRDHVVPVLPIEEQDQGHLPYRLQLTKGGDGTARMVLNPLTTVSAFESGT